MIFSILFLSAGLLSDAEGLASSAYEIKCVSGNEYQQSDVVKSLNKSLNERIDALTKDSGRQGFVLTNVSAPSLTCAETKSGGAAHCSLCVTITLKPVE